MTPEERRLLTELAAKISQTPPPQRDPEAEDFIRKNIGSRPDALYLMTQTVLIQNMAIQQAQQQIRDLQQRPPQTGYAASAGSGSFLGGQPPQFNQSPQYAQPPQPAYAPPSPAPVLSQSSGAGFLRSAAQTAAGVAAGALAFEGMRSLFSHPFGLGQSGLMGGVGMPVEETVINNNYYDSPGSEGHHAQHLVDTSDNSINSDDSNDTDNDVQTQDADYDDSSNSDDSSSYDDSSDNVA